MIRRDRAHWVYRCYDATGRLIYVGSTHNLFGRLDQHRSGAWWAPQVAKVTGAVYPDRTTARRAESKAIASELPRWNVLGKWATRGVWDEQDWRDYLHAVRTGGAASHAVKKHIERVERDFRALYSAEVAA